jgi:putative flippase GtrA
MSVRILSPVQPLYLRHKELLLYLFFAGLTTVLSIGLFWAFTRPMHISELIANVLGWIVCVLFAYATNRTWVFQDNAHDTRWANILHKYTVNGEITNELIQALIERIDLHQQKKNVEVSISFRFNNLFRQVLETSSDG